MFDLSELAPEPDDEPSQPQPPRLIRPLLSTTRQQVEEFLLSLGQPFRQDASNLSPHFLRNRVRADLLPALERDYNPRLRQALCETAEIASAENVFLENLVSSVLGANSGQSLPIPLLQVQPLALQRRILRRLCQPHALALDFSHLETLREFALAGHAERLNLPRGFVAEVVREKLCPPRLVLRPPEQNRPAEAYSMELPVPGSVLIGEHCGQPGMYIRASMLGGNVAEPTYNRVTLLNPARAGSCLAVRNLLPGDRFRPLHSSGERKINRLLQDLSIPAMLRRSWPVVLAGERIVWVPGLPVAEHAAWSPGDNEAIVLEMYNEEGTILYG
jgi:tRNA(Ile)-lysidine synthase